MTSHSNAVLSPSTLESTCPGCLVYQYVRIRNRYAFAGTYTFIIQPRQLHATQRLPALALSRNLRDHLRPTVGSVASVSAVRVQIRRGTRLRQCEAEPIQPSIGQIVTCYPIWKVCKVCCHRGGHMTGLYQWGRHFTASWGYSLRREASSRPELLPTRPHPRRASSEQPQQLYGTPWRRYCPVSR